MRKKIKLTTIPAGPPLRPAAGRVADFNPYPGFGAVRRDDTTNLHDNQHGTCKISFSN